MNVKREGGMDRWMVDGWMDGGWIEGRIDGWMVDGGWMDGWMDGWWMDERMDGWMVDGWIIAISGLSPPLQYEGVHLHDPYNTSGVLIPHVWFVSLAPPPSPPSIPESADPGSHAATLPLRSFFPSGSSRAAGLWSWNT